MTKALKIILSFLALISISFSLVIFFDFNPLQEIKDKLVPESKSSPVSLTEEEFSENLSNDSQLKEIPKEFIFVSPLEEKDLEEAFIDEENPRSLSALLNSETLVRATFDGKVIKVLYEIKPNSEIKYPLKSIWLETSDKAFQASYLFVGESLVNEGDFVKIGENLIKIQQIEPDIDLGINFLFSFYDKEKNPLKLSKEIFK